VSRVEMVNGIDEIARKYPSKHFTAPGRRFEEPANDRARVSFGQALPSAEQGSATPVGAGAAARTTRGLEAAAGAGAEP